MSPNIALYCTTMERLRSKTWSCIEAYLMHAYTLNLRLQLHFIINEYMEMPHRYQLNMFTVNDDSLYHL